ISVKVAGKYKYVLDVDGHGWSSQLKRLMLTNALTFNSTIYPEWCHLVPFQNAYSDLYDALVLFRGDLAGRGVYEELECLTFWIEEDIVASRFRCVRVLCRDCGGVLLLLLSIPIYFLVKVDFVFQLVPHIHEDDERGSKRA
ncbi:hypothetical protein K503DRAFT_691041, partial [Rhizopogon vinicolor AM-OR11-026]